MHFILSKTEDKAFYLFDSREYVVGRKDCDILIKDDTSISRKHAFLSIKNDKMYITDLGAKYNTFINGMQLKANEPTELNINDEVKFGILNSIYLVKEDKLNVTTSGLTVDEKKVLSRVLKRLDGNIMSSWSKDCSYLTVREIMLTLKVLCALIEKQPIVTISFWTAYIKNVTEGLPPPNPKSYKPSYAEIMLNRSINLEEKCSRKTLFKNKIFIFKDKTSKAKIQTVVELAGGTCFYWEEKPLTKEHFSSCNPQYLLIHDDAETATTDDSFVKMTNHLRSIGKRSIPFQEIAMAVVVATCEKDCNPDFDRAGTLIKEKEQIIFTNDILAPETQTQRYGIDQNPSIVVPETIIDPYTPQINITSNKNQELRSKGNVAENTGEIETYSTIFDTGSGQPKCIVSSTQKEDADVKSHESSSTLNDIKEAVLSKKQSSLKRGGQAINGNGKRKRLESDNMEIDKWITKHQPTDIKKSNSIDLTLDVDDYDKANIVTEKEKDTISNTSKANNQLKEISPFGFERCLSKPKFNSTFLKPAPPSKNVIDTIVIDLDSPSTSGKRRLDTSPPGPSKKKAFFGNPFSSKIQIEKSVSESPFQKDASIKESKTSNSPFSMRGKKSEKAVKPNSQESQRNIAPIVYRFNVTVVDEETDKNHGWLSKFPITNNEVDNTAKNTKNFDENMQQFMESFRDCVIVEKENLVVARPIINNKETTINNKKNFKKFKKVQPLHIQTTIIPSSSYREMLNSEVKAW
ncbi:putative second BRCT domain on Nijmegen syndrome breakage protein [Trypoxylus dichotomus]